ncbi:MAG: hypothetical protein ABI479_06595, partial [Gallionella sp.]
MQIIEIPIIEDSTALFRKELCKLKAFPSFRRRPESSKTKCILFKPTGFRPGRRPACPELVEGP